VGCILILAEKPSVAADIAAVFPGAVRREGYYEAEGGSIFPGKEVVVTWAYGHLLELKDAGEYTSEWKTWSLETLPIFPERFSYSPVKRTRRQLEIIRRLFREKPVERGILATDADREGHTLGMLILRHVGWRGPTLRFWTSEALTPSVVRRVLTKELRPNEEFDDLFEEGLARQHADWLYGINLTRAMTKAFESEERGRASVISIGRCQTAVLAILAEREKAIRDFRPQPYWLIRAQTEFGPAWLADGPRLSTCKRFSDCAREDETKKSGTGLVPFRFAEEECAREVFAEVAELLEKRPLRVENVKERTVNVPPPGLFSLSELQTEANRLYGFSAAKTLELAQSLYDRHKMITYPRTSCPFVASTNLDKLARTLLLLGISDPEERIRRARSRLVNDRKVAEASHHAILVERTASIRGENLSPDERKLFELICARIRAAVSEEAVRLKTEAELSCGAFRFVLFREALIRPGWTKIYPPGKRPEEPASTLRLRRGDEVRARAFLDRRTTEPPPRYTEGTLISAMKNAWRYVADPELARVLKETRGIGTDATRDQFIETLKARRYIVVSGRTIRVSERGLDVFQAARKLGLAAADPGMTALWEKRLAEIGAGRESYRRFLEDVKARIAEEVERIKKAAGTIRIDREGTFKRGKEARKGQRKKTRFRRRRRR